MTNQIHNQSIMNTINWRDTTHFDSEATTAQVVETSVTVNSNSPIQDILGNQEVDSGGEGKSKWAEKYGTKEK